MGPVATLDHVALACRDPERSLRFYREVLAVEGAVRETGDGFVITTTSAVTFTLLRGEPPASMGTSTWASRCPSRTPSGRHRARFAALGLPEHEWADDADYVSVKVRDPDGYIVEVSWDAPDA